MLYNEELLEFLKKYSDVDIDFIREFIEIQNDDQEHYPHAINLETVAKWLHSSKKELAKTIKRSYTKNIDYIVLQGAYPPQKTGSGGYNKEHILLTSDTFKMLCMRSHTQLADKIRYYYITLEKLVYLFKDEIIKNQQKHIKILENNQKKEKFPNGGLIYIVQPQDVSDLQLHKIGKTNNMDERKLGINNSLPDNIKILYTLNVDDPTAVETCIKGILHKYRYRSHKKDYYKCSLYKIIESIQICLNAINDTFCDDCKKILTKEFSRNKHSEDVFGLYFIPRQIGGNTNYYYKYLKYVVKYKQLTKIEPQNINMLTDNICSDDDLSSNCVTSENIII